MDVNGRGSTWMDMLIGGDVLGRVRKSPLKQIALSGPMRRLRTRRSASYQSVLKLRLLIFDVVIGYIAIEAGFPDR
jgi:hypothetical protein